MSWLEIAGELAELSQIVSDINRGNNTHLSDFNDIFESAYRRIVDIFSTNEYIPRKNFLLAKSQIYIEAENFSYIIQRVRIIDFNSFPERTNSISLLNTFSRDQLNISTSRFPEGIAYYCVSFGSISTTLDSIIRSLSVPRGATPEKFSTHQALFVNSLSELDSLLRNNILDRDAFEAYYGLSWGVHGN